VRAGVVSPNRIASAQPPRMPRRHLRADQIAAEMTVMTLGQTISAFACEEGCMLMERSC